MRLILRHHQATKRTLRDEGEEVNNQTILAMLDREEFIGETLTKNLQQRRQTAHETTNGSVSDLREGESISHFQ